MRTVPLACPPVEFGLHLEPAEMTVFAPIESLECTSLEQRILCE